MQALIFGIENKLAYKVFKNVLFTAFEVVA